MERKRLSPETLLKRAKKEELDEQRGKLKIYLGAAPGVGKTYTMLHDALALRKQGLDVVVGIVESHGRQEIETFLTNFEILPRQRIDYRGKGLLEFDLDAALKRNPALILMDEMAHTNISGAKHIKRWQDIKELLDRGIDVYTTLNVQHIESLNEAVSQIIHSHVNETVPDAMIELSDSIELIDLPPEDLLKRLQDGKVYFPAQADLAQEHFFRKGNLSALRELALRITAERVGNQVLSYRQDLGIKYIWPTKEKILVCVGNSIESAKLIRTAKRMAKHNQAEWMAVHIDIPQKTLTPEQHSNIAQHLRLAEMLGAEISVLTGFDVANQIMTFAREQNVTQLIVGKINRPRWKNFLFPSLADDLVRQSGEIDVYIITSEASDLKKIPKISHLKHPIRWQHYIVAAAVISFAILLNAMLYPVLDAHSSLFFYLLVITNVTLCGASYLTILMYRQADFARHTEQRTALLYGLSKKLVTTRGISHLLTAGIEYIGDTLHSEVLALLPNEGRLTVVARYNTNQVLDEKALSVAQWVYDLGQTAGLGTDTLSHAEALYIPLLTASGSLGVLRLRPIKHRHAFSPQEMHFLESATHQIALAIQAEQGDDSLV
jgi:two-component system sensor histidine kinase KdpD